MCFQLARSPNNPQKDIFGQLMSVRDHMSGSSEKLQEWTSQRHLIDLVTTMATSLPDEKGSKHDDPKSPPPLMDLTEESVRLERHEVADPQTSILPDSIILISEDAQSKAEPSLSQDAQPQCFQTQPEPEAACHDSQDFKSGKVPNTPAEILVGVAGTSCTDFAGYGKREGNAGKNYAAIHALVLGRPSCAADVDLHRDRGRGSLLLRRKTLQVLRDVAN